MLMNPYNPTEEEISFSTLQRHPMDQQMSWLKSVWPSLSKENPMDRGAWQATVHGVANCWNTMEQLTLSPFHYRGLSVSSNSFSASVKLFI